MFKGLKRLEERPILFQYAKAAYTLCSVADGSAGTVKNPSSNPFLMSPAVFFTLSLYIILLRCDKTVCALMNNN